MDGHKGHDSVTAVEWTNTLKEWRQRRSQQRIQEREKELQELRKAVETLKSSAQTAVEDSDRIFTEMIRSIQRRRAEVRKLIRAQEKAEVSRAEGLLKRLEQEIADLMRSDAELEQLSHTEDHIHFLLMFQSVSGMPQSEDLTSITVNQCVSFEAVEKSVSTLKGQLEDICQEEVMQISEAVSGVKAVSTEPMTREEFLLYSSCFTLDPNTADRNLHLFEGSKRVECRGEVRSYPDHPERFDGPCYEVLCKYGVCGRCYWEVAWTGRVGIAVSYKSISRTGEFNDRVLGRNDQCWRLDLSSSRSYFWHNNKVIQLPLVANSRIGVYLDHRAGTLAFYSITDTMTLLHRVQTTFTQPLYPAFFICGKSSLELLKPKNP